MHIKNKRIELPCQVICILFSECDNLHPPCLLPLMHCLCCERSVRSGTECLYRWEPTNQSTKSIRLFSSPPVLTIIANRLFPDSFGPTCSSILKFCVKKGASTRPDLSIQKHFLWRILTINFSKLYYLWVFALWWWLLYHTHLSWKSFRFIIV